MVSHPEPDILECEVKWALRSTAVNKANGCNEIPAELFKSLKDDGFTFIVPALLEDPAAATGQSSFKFSRRAVPKNVLISGQLHSPPMLVRSFLKSCMLGFSIIRTKNFHMSKLGLEKEEELENKLPTFAGL